MMCMYTSLHTSPISLLLGMYQVVGQLSGYMLQVIMAMQSMQEKCSSGTTQGNESVGLRKQTVNS